MIKKLASLALALCLSLTATAAWAADDIPGAELKGLSLTLGYQGAYMYYSERNALTNNELDKDYGWMSGGFADVRYDFNAAFARLRFDAMGSNRATYDGALQNGTPLKMYTHEFMYKSEFDLGYKLFDQDQATFSPYMGIGYRSWRRGENVQPSYVEDYTWWYTVLGVNHMFRTGKWLLGVDASLLFPFAMKMETDMRGLYDKATFDIKSKTGFRVETPVSYEIYASGDTRLSLTGIPFYERWEIGKSPTVTMTRNGNATSDSYYEPKSTTDILGVRIGLGLQF